MKAFVNVIMALLAAAGVVLVTMKVIEAISRSDKDNQRLAMFKGKFELPKPGKRTKLGEIRDSVSDKIEDFRFSSDDDDLFADLGEDIKDFAEDAADEAADIFDDISDTAEDFFEDAAEAVEDIADETADSVEDALEEVTEIVEEISEDDLDKLLGSND